jgi:hypothetical protein
MSGCVDEAVRELRSEMGELKDWILCEKKELLSLIDQITVTASHQAHHLASVSLTQFIIRLIRVTCKHI